MSWHLLPQLWLLLLQWWWCLLVCHLFHLLCQPPPSLGFLQHTVSVIWFYCHQGALEVLLALPLCHSSSVFVLDASSDLCQLCHGFATGRFLFWSWACHCFVYYTWCLFWCLFSTFRCHAVCHIHLWELSHWVLHCCNPLEFTCGRHMCNLVMVIGQHQVCTDWLLHPLPWVGGAFCYSISCSPAIPSIWWCIPLWGLGRESPNHSNFPAWWGGVFFSRFCSIQWHGWLWIRLMHLLTTGLQSGLLLIPSFILGSLVRCHH